MLTLILCLIFGPILLLIAANTVKFAVITPISNGYTNIMDWSIQFKILMLIPLGVTCYIVYIITQMINYYSEVVA